MNHLVSKPVFDEAVASTPPDQDRFSVQASYVATAAEAMDNYRKNAAAIWYKDKADPNDAAGKYAFQRLRQPCFVPHIVPKFKFRRNDKFYAIGSCFARGVENALAAQNVIVESAAPEFARLQAAKR